MIVEYITRNNLLRASVFSVVTTIPACILVVLLKIYGGESLALPRFFFYSCCSLIPSISVILNTSDCCKNGRYVRKDRKGKTD